MAIRIRLNPLDDVAAVVDDALRHAGLPGANCAHVTTLQDRVDVDRLGRAAGQLARRHVLATARLDRPWWAWRPSWVLQPDAPISVSVLDEEGEADPAAIAAGYLNEPMDPRRDPPVKITLHRARSGGDAIALKWSHVLSDSRGGEFLVRELGRCYAGDYDGPEAAVPPRPPALVMQGKMQGKSTLRPGPAGGGGKVFCAMNVGAAGRVRLRITRMGDTDSARLRDNAMRLAGFGRLPIFVFAAYLRALRRACDRAGQPDAVLRTSWPVELRAGPPPESLPGNEFGILNLQCPAGETTDLAGLVQRLTRDVIRLLGKGEHRFLWHLGRGLKLGFFPVLCLANRWTGFLMRGPRLSTQFRFGGRLLGGDHSWGGIPIDGGCTATVCSREHPVAVGLGEMAGRFQYGATWLDGAIADEALDRLLEDFRDELLGADDESRPPVNR